MTYLFAGVIRTNAVLDRESKEFYWLSVFGCDRAIVPRCSVAEVCVRVDDVNDNKPRTPLPVYYPEVKENSEEGVVVLQLEVRIVNDLEHYHVITFDLRPAS